MALPIPSKGPRLVVRQRCTIWRCQRWICRSFDSVKWSWSWLELGYGQTKVMTSSQSGMIIQGCFQIMWPAPFRNIPPWVRIFLFWLTTPWQWTIWQYPYLNRYPIITVLSGMFWQSSGVRKTICIKRLSKISDHGPFWLSIKVYIGTSLNQVWLSPTRVNQ